MTEDWRASLDIREAVTAVAVNLTKAFDSVRHPRLLAKLKAYGFTDGLWNLPLLIFLEEDKELKLMVFILSGEL